MILGLSGIGRWELTQVIKLLYFTCICNTKSHDAASMWNHPCGLFGTMYPRQWKLKWVAMNMAYQTHIVDSSCPVVVHGHINKHCLLGTFLHNVSPVHICHQGPSDIGTIIMGNVKMSHIMLNNNGVICFLGQHRLRRC